MKRRPTPRRAPRWTAAPHATPASFRVEGNVWMVGVDRVVPVNSAVVRAYAGHPPTLRGRS